MTLPDERFYKTCARELTNWFEQNQRDLPWRKTRDPYAVLVSELMLQQTQVERVKSYLSRWMERFPNVSALAVSGEECVLAAWQGLGYYSRARNLHKCAQTLLADGHETLPADPDYLRRLPGVGPYTLGAVCSIAFEMPVPAVDGNVRRVFSRLLDLESDPTKKDGASQIESAVKDILLRGQPHILTQAFMELGATVCMPLMSCKCDECPVAALCSSLQNGTQSQRPVTERREKIIRRNGVALLVGDPHTGWLVRRRHKGGLWSEFYEIPWTIGEEHEDFSTCLQKLRNEFGCSAPSKETGLEETLRFTHWQVCVRLWRTSLPENMPENTELVPTAKLFELPMPAGIRRLVSKALKKCHYLTNQ